MAIQALAEKWLQPSDSSKKVIIESHMLRKNGMSVQKVSINILVVHNAIHFWRAAMNADAIVRINRLPFSMFGQFLYRPHIAVNFCLSGGMGQSLVSFWAVPLTYQCFASWCCWWLDSSWTPPTPVLMGLAFVCRVP